MNNSYLVKKFTPLKPREFQTQHLYKTMYVQDWSWLVKDKILTIIHFQLLKIYLLTQENRF